MPRRHHVVIVAQNPALATALFSWLGTAGYELAIVTTFAAAKALLETKPALIISELKLGEYNGLHLALKARAVGIPTIIIGPQDPVLQKDADELGATYLTSVVKKSHVMHLVTEHVAQRELPVADDLLVQFERDSRMPQAAAGRRVLH